MAAHGGGFLPPLFLPTTPAMCHGESSAEVTVKFVLSRVLKLVRTDIQSRQQMHGPQQDETKSYERPDQRNADCLAPPDQTHLMPFQASALLE